MISSFVFSSSSMALSAILESQPSEKSAPCPLLILLKRMSFICLLVYQVPHILKYVLIMRIHRLASLLLPEKSSGRPAFTSTRAVVVDMSSLSLRKISKWSKSLLELEGSEPGGVECEWSREGWDVGDSWAAAKAHWKTRVLGKGGREGGRTVEVTEWGVLTKKKLILLNIMSKDHGIDFSKGWLHKMADNGVPEDEKTKELVTLNCEKAFLLTDKNSRAWAAPANLCMKSPPFRGDFQIPFCLWARSWEG